CALHLSRRIPDHSVSALRTNDRIGEVCAKPVIRAELADVRIAPGRLLASWSVGWCRRALVGLRALFPGSKFSFRLAGTGRELGRVGRNLLPIDFRDL